MAGSTTAPCRNIPPTVSGQMLAAQLTGTAWIRGRGKTALLVPGLLERSTRPLNPLKTAIPFSNTLVRVFRRMYMQICVQVSLMSGCCLPKYNITSARGRRVTSAGSGSCPCQTRRWHATLTAATRVSNVYSISVIEFAAACVAAPP